MPNPGIRARVERLLRRDFRVSDLSTLFLYARERCDGRESVREVGNFVAHHSERTKGIITQMTREWCITAWFHCLSLQRGLDVRRLRANFPEFLRASFNRLDHQTIKKATGMRRVDASKMLPTLIGKFRRNDDGTLALSVLHTPPELALLRCLCDHLVAKPAFNNETLFKDLLYILINEGDLNQFELADIQYLKPAIGLFAISYMHNCVIDIGDGSKLTLTATDNAASVGDLGVLAAAPVLLLRPVAQLPPGSFVSIQGRPEQAIMLAAAMFTTELDAATYCTPDLFAAPRPWAMPLEITNDMRLGVLS